MNSHWSQLLTVSPTFSETSKKKRKSPMMIDVFANALKRVALLAILIAGTLCVSRPLHAFTETCQQMCQSEESQCVKGCHSNEGCLEICAELLRGCLNGCS
jgi:hypothetical protein